MQPVWSAPTWFRRLWWWRFIFHGFNRLFNFASSKRFSVYHSTLNAHRFEKRLPDLHHHDTLLWTIIFWYIEDSKEKHVLMFFYITAQRDGHAEPVSASHCEPLLTPLPRWYAELNSAWHLESFVIYNTHFGEANSILLSKNKNLRPLSYLRRLCAILRFGKRILQNKTCGNKGVIDGKSFFVSWAEKSAQLGKNMFPVGKIYFPSWKLEIEGLLDFFLKNLVFVIKTYLNKKTTEVKIFDINDELWAMRYEMWVDSLHSDAVLGGFVSNSTDFVRGYSSFGLRVFQTHSHGITLCRRKNARKTRIWIADRLSYPRFLTSAQ